MAFVRPSAAAAAAAAPDVKAGVDPRAQLASHLEEMRNAIKAYQLNPDLKGHTDKLSAAGALLAQLNVAGKPLDQFQQFKNYFSKAVDQKRSIQAPRRFGSESPTGVALIRCLEQGIEKIEALVQASDKVHEQAAVTIYQPTVATKRSIVNFRMDEKDGIHAVLSNNPTNDLIVHYHLDDASNAVREEKAAAIAEPDAGVINNRCNRSIFLPDGSVVHMRNVGFTLLIHLVRADNQIEARGECYEVSMSINKIISINNEEYLINIMTENTLQLFLLPKNQLADWIKQGASLEPSGVKLVKLLEEFCRDGVIEEWCPISPKENMMICYKDNALRVYELLHHSDKTELKLIWSDGRNLQRDYMLSNVLQIRPGFFAVVMWHPGTAMGLFREKFGGVRSPSRMQPQHLLIEEWSLEEILGNKAGAVLVQPYRTSKSFGKLDGILAYSPEFLQDGRSFFYVNLKRDASAAVARIHDLETNGDPQEVCISDETDATKIQVIANSMRPRDGRCVVSLSDMENLRSITAVSFPLVEKRCHDIPEIIQQSNRNPNKFPKEIVRLMTHGYLGMFYHEKPTPRPPLVTPGDAKDQLKKR